MNLSRTCAEAAGVRTSCGHRIRVKPLALCLSAILLQSHVAPAPASSRKTMLPQVHLEHLASAAYRGPDHPYAPQIWTVKNCGDTGTDSLRDIIENPMKAQSGDTVDLSQLPMLCGTDAQITLTTGEIVAAQDDLTLQGADPTTTGTVTISGGGTSRVFHHEGLGIFELSSLTIADGYYRTAGNAYGGCIASDNGSVYLFRTTVTSCKVVSDTGYANGGGVSASFAGDVTVIGSTISGNQANAPSLRGFGGGIYSRGALSAKYSSISGNAENDGPSEAGDGGGAFVVHGTTIFASTISNNTAGFGSGLDVGGLTTIASSTISGNMASIGGALFSFGTDSLAITNSTIAFNHQNASFSYAGGVVFKGLSANSVLTLQSSIIADNTVGASNTPGDVYIVAGHGALAGADNLLIASNVLDPNVITVSAEPNLGPLQFNGGVTRTHALLSGSPALGVGNNSAMQSNDQRGTGYPRTTGPNGSIDIGAIQSDTIFVGSFDFE